MLAGFGGLLNRLTGQSDLVVGIAAAGQASAGLEGLIGHCVSTLPLRLAIDRSAAFTDLIATSRVVLLDAYDHQDVTFSRVLQALPIARDPGRLPLISVLFNIDQALASESMAMPGLHLELTSNPRVAETFELFVNAVDGGAAGMRLECQYNSGLFDERTIARWMSAFEQLLAAAVAEPGAALGRLSLRDCRGSRGHCELESDCDGLSARRAHRIVDRGADCPHAECTRRSCWRPVADICRDRQAKRGGCCEVTRRRRGQGRSRRVARRARCDAAPRAHWHIAVRCCVRAAGSCVSPSSASLT